MIATIILATITLFVFVGGMLRSKIEPDYIFIQNTRYTRVTAHCIIFDSIKALIIHIEANHEQEVNKYEQLLEKIKQKHKTLITYINERFG